ncbi:DUF808 domain-containing protein [Leucobacter aridicollis]|uniref:ABC transporter n=1 Tax=Leucobacter aridicollis TaxID=283878 RepID=A0A852RFN1_9MICO|nr:DUF808 domain-containing protein [Leucobacter aridicollis]MBL3683285.1 DUF808 domain-containing protein [Leucobacter aridicollis]NYD25522.1 hypothetical protein [Leucobacter aridicollis]
MSASFFALLDDIAVLARAAAASIDDVVAGAAKASAKAAGVVIDDAAVSPQYVQGLTPKRELPVVWKITRGSLLNKAIIIAGIMVLSAWAPWIFPWLLILGGTYLAYEGAEKVWHWIRPSHAAKADVEQVVERTATDEKQMVSSAVRTDLVLSIEIMLISLANIEASSWGIRLATLIVVGLLMTVAVYGTVALLIRMDDVGFWLIKRPAQALQAIGRGLVKAMPWVFRALTVVGALAMLWVGGHILLVNLAEVGVSAPYDIVSGIVHAAPLPGVVAWFVDSGLSAIFGLAWGLVVMLVLGLIARLRFKKPVSH